MKNNVVQDKSYAFALRIVKTYQFLCSEKKEYVLSKQLLRAGTSVGANVEEALGGQSDKDFLSKISIAYKEARESHFWIRLLRDSSYFTQEQAESLLKDNEELLKNMGSIKKTMREKVGY